MKGVIITQEEPFYIPVFLNRVLSGYEDITAVITLPGLPYGFNYITYAKRLFDIFGLTGFLKYGFLFVWYRFLDLVSRIKKLPRYYSIKGLARGYGIPVYTMKNINEKKTINLLKSLAPDILISVAAPQVFKKKVLSVARYTINSHAALLPDYQGMIPSFWVLARGEKTTGVTVHHMNAEIDRGNIIVQRVIDITPSDTLHSLQTKVAHTGAESLLEALHKVNNGTDDGKPPKGKGSYYSFPTKESARMLREKGRKCI